MDRAKAAFFAARQELAGTLSGPDAADRAVTELVKVLTFNDLDPSPFSSHDSNTLRALALVWGSTAGQGDKGDSQKIDAYRKRYVAAKGGSAEERGAAAAEFDKKVQSSLARLLGPRNRSAYDRALNQQEQRWMDGNVTRTEMQEKMVAVVKQLVADTANINPGTDTNERTSHFRNEVKGALGFVENEQDLMQALNYLWGAMPNQERDDEFKQFDVIVNDVVSMMVASDVKYFPPSKHVFPYDHSKAISQKKRVFIAEARNYLGSLLPDQNKVAKYMDGEASALGKHIAKYEPDYNAYKQEMLQLLASMQTAVIRSPERSESARLASAVDDAVNKLLEDRTVSHWRSVSLSGYDALQASYLNTVDHRSAERWREFQECRDQYVDISVEKKQNENASRRAFMRAVQKALIEKLPDQIKNDFKELLKELESFLKKDFITSAVYNFTALKLFNKVNGKELGDESAASKVFLQFSGHANGTHMVENDLKGSGSLHDEVTEALKSVLEPDSDPAKVLSCLGYFWGVSETRLNRNKYTEFNSRRNRYMQAHGGKAVSDIPTDCEFVREAQNILAGRLPAWLQEQYTVQQDALKQFGMSATDIAESTGHFLLSFLAKPQ